MTDFGYYTLLIALILSSHAMAASALGAWRRRRDLVASGEKALTAQAAVLSIAGLALLHALVTRNFDVAYVARHTDSHLPLFYTVAAFWAGQEGSLLFWALALAIFSAIAVRQNRQRNRAIMPFVTAALAGINLFFICLLVFAANPFALSVAPVTEGNGLNPLLRNPGMVFHPPLVLAGYVGFAIPFAFAIGALAAKQLDSTWIRTTRRWTLVAWLCLTAGILLGAEWAYKVLGWGGYWAWDPVENASLIPWLVGTAYLHSVMIQEKKGMLKVWNLALIILTFELAVFGTFLTRSGVVSSVHSFGVSSLGPLFFTFLLTTTGFSVALLWSRRKLVRSDNRLESVLSRESSFLFNNLILVGIAFAVLLGTMFPVISELVTGDQISVGAPFYNKVTAPFGLGLLVLTGVCPLIAWRKASWDNIKKNFLWPAAGALLTATVLFSLGVRKGMALAFFSVCAFVIVVTVLEFARGGKARSHMTGERYPTAIGKLISRNRRRYGGFIVHAGAVVLFAGIIGSSYFQSVVDGTLSPGQSLEAGSYSVRLKRLESEQDSSRQSVYASLELHQNGALIDELRPSKHFYPNSEQPMTDVAIRTTPLDDVYVILNGWEQDGSARLRVLINPLAAWIWAGGGIMLLGTLILIWPEPRRLPATVRLPREAACDVA